MVDVHSVKKTTLLDLGYCLQPIFWRRMEYLTNSQMMGTSGSITLASDGNGVGTNLPQCSLFPESDIL